MTYFLLIFLTKICKMKNQLSIFRMNWKGVWYNNLFLNESVQFYS